MVKFPNLKLTNFHHQSRRGFNNRYSSSNRSGSGYRSKGKTGGGADGKSNHGSGDKKFLTRSFNIQDMSFMSEL